MDMVSKLGSMVQNMKEIINLEKNMEKVFFLGKIEFKITNTIHFLQIIKI